MVTGGAERSGVVGISGGRIVHVGPHDPDLSGRSETVVGDDAVVLPGLVDTHVHVCDPGHPDWEGFPAATAAAAAGGITTLVDMPLDCVPATVDVDALEAKRSVAAGRCHVDVGFWGGVVPGNLGALPPMASAGVLGFKCFLADSGTADFPPVDVVTMTAALGALRPLGLPLLVHAEFDADEAVPPDGPGYADWLATRPASLEDAAVAAVVDAAHIVHLSSADAIPTVAGARREGVDVTAETCPHYLALAAEEIPEGATAAKCSPPVRAAANRDRLWAGLRAGLPDMVVSDHSPCLPTMKRAGGDFAAAWGGIASLQLGLPVVWSAARARGVGLAEVAGWMSSAPARLAGLTDRGRIAVGARADLCVVAPDETFVVDPAALRHRHGLTPYTGRRLSGVVRATMLAGAWVDPDGAPLGRLVTRRVAAA
jgi:allantoinase